MDPSYFTIVVIIFSFFQSFTDCITIPSNPSNPDNMGNIASWNPSNGNQITSATSSNSHCSSSCILFSCCNDSPITISKSFTFDASYESLVIETVAGYYMFGTVPRVDLQVKCNGNWYTISPPFKKYLADIGQTQSSRTEIRSITETNCDGISSIEIQFQAQFPSSTPGNAEQFGISNVLITGDPVPTVSPTKRPTVTPSLQPTDSPTTGPTISPTTATPTKSPTFGKQRCNEMFVVKEQLSDYIHMMNISTNVTLSNVTFKIYDFVGINDHLYWDYIDLNTINVTYRLYYDSAWIMRINMVQYKYIDDDNSTETIIDAAGYPPLDQLTSWFLLNNNSDLNDINMNNSIQLYLSCIPADIEDVSVAAQKKMEYASYVIVVMLLVMGILLALIAFVFHLTKSGCDKPDYLPVIQCFIHIANIYVDLAFVYAIYVNGLSLLWYLIPIILILSAYILSISTALYKINNYKQITDAVISGYIKSFDKLWLTLTLIVGFYNTFNLLSSHIFHLGMTSFQIPKREKNNVKTLHIINFVLVQNVGMLFIQIMYLLSIGYFDIMFDGKIDITSDAMGNIALLSMLITVISLFLAIMTIISKVLCGDKCCSSSMEIEHFYMDIVSKTINKNHIHSHLLISVAFSKVIGVNRSSVETLNIVQKTKAIHCKMCVGFHDDDDIEDYEKLFSVLSIKCDVKKSLKNEIKSALKLENIKNISFQKIKGNTIELNKYED